MDKLKLENKLRKYDEAYYHGTKTLISDQEYDNLINQYELLYEPYVKIASNKDQLLPMPAPSLDKIKLENKLLQWDESHPGDKILSDKIDGMSMIIQYDNNTKIYTHSDSVHGTNISHLLPYLNIPKKIDGQLKVRGELTIKLSTYEQKYKDKYVSPRNIISGVINKKIPDVDTLKDLVYLVFQVENDLKLTPEEQFEFAKQYGFNIVTGIYKVSNLQYNNIKEDLESPCEYPRDGKTIALNVYETPTPSLPENKIAFKIMGKTAITTVINVEWNESKHCLLKPRINYEPVFLDGGNLTWTSGFHGKFIQKHNIGPGTKLLITRSGCIIPYILEVIESTTASLPEKYTWDKTETNILCEVNDEVMIKRLHYFFSLMGCKYLGLKMMAKIYLAGFVTINDIINITMDELTKIEGIKEKGAERILQAIKIAIKNVTLSKVIVGSVLFPGFGEIKVDSILSSIPKLYNILLFDDNTITVEELKNVDGINQLALLFYDQLDEFKEFLNEMPIIKKQLIDNYQLSKNLDLQTFDNINTEIITPPLIIPEYKGQPLKGMYIVFSGDKKLTNKCKELGAIVDKNVKKQTTLLIVDQLGTMNNKEKICTEKKIPIMSLKDFKLKYNL